MAVNSTQNAGDGAGGEARLRQERRQQVMHEHVLGGLDVLGRVVRFLTGYAFAPALALVGDRFDEQDVTLELGPERRLERSHERDPDPPQLDCFQLHGANLASTASCSSLSSSSAAATFCS